MNACIIYIWSAKLRVFFGEKLTIISRKKNFDDITSFDQFGTTQVDLGLLSKQQTHPEIVECAVATVYDIRTHSVFIC